MDFKTPAGILQGCGAFACRAEFSQYPGVAGIARATSDAFEVCFILAETTQGDGVVNLNAEFRLDAAVAVLCLGKERINLPAFDRPSSRDRIDNPRRDRSRAGHRGITHHQDPLPRGTQTPCQQASG